MPGLESVLRERKRVAELRRAQRDPWYLAGKLGYHYDPTVGKGLGQGKGLTERLHKPIFDNFIVPNDVAPFLWLEMARFSHKTTMWVIEMTRDILNDPCIQLGYFHAVFKKADEVVREVGHLLQHHPYLRSLEPIGRREDGSWYNVLPSPNEKNFVSSAKGITEFTLRARHKFRRFATLAGAGALSESTGAHMNKAYVDDIISRMTVRNGKVYEVGEWYEHTLLPVVDDLIIRASGTPWCDFGLYEETFKVGDDWRSIVIPGGMKVADPALPLADVDWTQRHIRIEREDDLRKAAPIYGRAEDIRRKRKHLEILKRQMKSNFEPQIQCNPSPPGDKPWDAKKCEHNVSKDDAFAHGGLLVLLSDPAPFLIGPQHEPLSARQGEEDFIKDKDDWAHAVILLRARGQRQQAILIDGKFSNTWDDNEGWKVACQLQKKWGVYYVGIEGAGAEYAAYCRDHEKAARNLGAYADYIKFQSTYLGKNSRFNDMVAMAKLGDFLFCEETCDREFLAKWLNQCRSWRPVGKRVAMKHDDLADATSYCTDPEVWELVPATEEIAKIREYLDEADMEEDDESSPLANIDI